MAAAMTATSILGQCHGPEIVDSEQRRPIQFDAHLAKQTPHEHDLTRGERGRHDLRLDQWRAEQLTADAYCHTPR